MNVIKLGGSLINDPQLRSCLASLANVGNLIIVPGGGPYADAVREQQQRWKFPDGQAHHMALLAMDQFALQLHGIESRLKLAGNLADIQRAKTELRSVIWVPSAMVLSDTNIANSWDITSDSLAVWLARTTNADQLILVKSCVIPPGVTIAELSDRGVVDRGFARMSANASQRIRIISIGDFGQMMQDIQRI